MPPPEGAKCHPSARNTLLPIAQEGQLAIRRASARQALLTFLSINNQAGSPPAREGCLAEAPKGAEADPFQVTRVSVSTKNDRNCFESLRDRSVLTRPIMHDGEKRIVYILRSDVYPSRHYVGLT